MYHMQCGNASTRVTCNVAERRETSTTRKSTRSRDGLSPNSAVEKTPTAASRLSSLPPCFSFPPTFHLFPLPLLPIADILLCSMVLQAIDHSSLFVLTGIKQVFFFIFHFSASGHLSGLYFTFLFFSYSRTAVIACGWCVQVLAWLPPLFFGITLWACELAYGGVSGR